MNILIRGIVMTTPTTIKSTSSLTWTRAGELQEVGDFTQVMVNDVGITEGQSQYASGVGHGPRKPYHIRTEHHQRTDMRRRGDHVQQRIADSYIAIISHQYQHTALRTDKETEEK